MVHNMHNWPDVLSFYLLESSNVRAVTHLQVNLGVRDCVAVLPSRRGA